MSEKKPKRKPRSKRRAKTGTPPKLHIPIPDKVIDAILDGRCKLTIVR